ncbi:peptidoglycan-binding LysM [Candidatus Moduliflexus flocculans]|uniref:Peptidoglycan-binding LysM n=1 Tax=Candidatus Moduliflexus flocculans TaxID=1499966 RepID=A0A0S6W3C8_9BACT|nr:peptidoglycan-binding LysM [Candidatus Moduliflexus flocculans]
MITRMMVGVGIALALYAPVRGYAQSSSNGNYIVQYGDTLWDIAAEQLNNPEAWRELHRNNPHITNPHLIYPGDVLGLVPGAGTNATGQETSPSGKRSDKMIARPWYGMPAPSPESRKTSRPAMAVVPTADFIEASGYIIPYSLKELMSGDFAQITGDASGTGETARVIHAEFNQPGLVFGDMIYINRGSANKVQEGDVFVAFTPRSEIFHPVTGELIGTQIDINGHLRVKNTEANISAAEIIKSYSYIEIGDHIIPASEISVPLLKPAPGNAKTFGLKVGNQLIAHILRERVGRQSMSYGDIVYIDVGAAQGVQPADNFIVFREIGEGFPRQAIGRLLVLSVQEQTATALVSESSRMFNIGEKAVLRR